MALDEEAYLQAAASRDLKHLYVLWERSERGSQARMFLNTAAYTFATLLCMRWHHYCTFISRAAIFVDLGPS